MSNSNNNSWMAAIAAGVVSFCALSVSIYEAYLMREQQAASVLPIIDFWAAYEPTVGYNLNLANKGLGPAFIRDIDVVVDGEVSNNWQGVLHKLHNKPIHHGESALIGSVMAVGEVGQLFTITSPEQGTLVWKHANRLSMEVCYCSVFDQCWVTKVKDLNVGTPVTAAIDSCQTGSGKSF